RMPQLAGLRVPQVDCVVVAPARDGLPIGCEGDASDLVRVSLQLAQLAGLRVPQLDRVAIAAGRDPFAIGRERDGARLYVLPFERLLQCAGRRIPERETAARVADGQGLAVGRERDRLNVGTLDLLPHRAKLSALHVVDKDHATAAAIDDGDGRSRAVTGKSQRDNFAIVFFNRLLERAGLCVPQLDRAVAAGAG